MKEKFLALVVALALLFSMSPAHAAFTAAEQSSIQQLVNSSNEARLAIQNIGNAILAGANSSNASILSRTYVDMSLGMKAMNNALAWLIEGSPTLGNMNTVVGLARATKVANAWSEINQASYRMQTVISGVNGALAAGPTNSTYVSLLNNAKFNLTNAVAFLNLVNRSLAYQNPYTNSFPNVIGPHGDYLPMMHWFFRANNYILESFYEMGVANKILTANGKAAYREVSQRGGDITYQLFQQMWGFATLSGTIKQDFFKVVGFLGPLTDVAPTDYHETIGTLLSWGQASPFLLSRFTDSWRNIDRAVWQLMRFPNCQNTSDPTSCAGFGGGSSSGDGSTPPPPADTQAPNVAILSPARDSTIQRGTQLTIQISATDNVAVGSVDVFIGGSKLCTDTSQPFACTWSVPNVPNLYTISAVATDTAGNKAGTGIFVRVP